MTGILHPINWHQMTYVSRNDIWANIEMIKRMTNFNMKQMKLDLWIPPMTSFDVSKEEEEIYRHNECMYEELVEDQQVYQREMEQLMGQLEMVYEQIIRYENSDDTYTDELRSAFYEKYTSEKNQRKNIIHEEGQFVTSVIKGALDGIVGVLEGISMFVVGTIAYIGSGAICILLPESYEPVIAQKTVNSVNHRLKLLLNDPMLLAEAFADGLNTGYETKGTGYFVGQGIVEVAEFFVPAGIGIKGVEKAGKAGKVYRAFRYADELKSMGKSIQRTEHITEALSKGKLSFSDLVDINFRASRATYEKRLKMMKEIEAAQRVSTHVGIPGKGNVIVKVKEVSVKTKGGILDTDAFFTVKDVDDIPDYQGFVAPAPILEGASGVDEYNRLLGLNYDGSTFPQALQYQCDVIPLDKNAQLAHPFERGDYIRKQSSPYTDTGFTSGGVKEYHAASWESQRRSGTYIGEVLPNKTIRKIFDRDGNLIIERQWKIRSEGKDRYGQWFMKDKEGKYNVPLGTEIKTNVLR